MKELAKICNVSVSTVSKVFSEAEDVSKETKQMIFEKAKALGCFGKFYKGRYHKKIIALICPELIGGYYAIFLNKLQSLIETSGALCMISADNFCGQKQAELIEYYVSYLKVDGCIVFHLREPLKKGYDIPIVSLFSQVDGCDCVDTDMTLALEEAVSVLYGYGHRDICFIGEDLTQTKAVIFENTIRKKKGCQYSVIHSDKRFEEAGVDGIDKIMAAGVPYTAVICAYDNIAIGAIKRLKELGFLIPEDISVLGINNIAASSFTETSLTTIDTTADDVCAILWHLMENKLKRKNYHVRQNIIVKPRLIIRESVGQVKQNKEE